MLQDANVSGNKGYRSHRRKDTQVAEQIGYRTNGVAGQKGCRKNEGLQDTKVAIHQICRMQVVGNECCSTQRLPDTKVVGQKGFRTRRWLDTKVAGSVPDPDSGASCDPDSIEYGSETLVAAEHEECFPTSAFIHPNQHIILPPYCLVFILTSILSFLRIVWYPP